MTSHPPSEPPLWSAADVARHLNLPVSTLYQWRYRGQGPQGRKIGRHLRFRPADVHRWVHEQE